MMDIDLRPTASMVTAGRKEVAPSRKRTDSVLAYLKFREDENVQTSNNLLLSISFFNIYMMSTNLKE